MRPLTFTLYASKTASSGEVATQSWTEWVPLLTTHEVRGAPEDARCDLSNPDDVKRAKAALERAKNGLALIFGEIPNDRSRKKASVIQMHALSADLEEKTDDEIARVFEKLAPFAYTVATTHKHGSDLAGKGARLRVVLPLAEPVAAEDWPNVWQRFNSLIFGMNDPATKDASRLNFCPSTFDANVAWSLVNEGRWISAASDLVFVPPIVSSNSGVQTSDAKLQRAVIRLTNALQRTPKAHEAKSAVASLLKGEAFAEPGHGHQAILDLTLLIAQRPFKVPEAAVAAVFEKSIEAMAQTSRSPEGMDAVLTAYRGALERVKEWEAADEEDRQERARSIQLSNADEDDEGSYSQQDLEAIAAAQKCTVPQLQKRWIIQKDTTYYFLTSSGYYSPVSSMQEARGNAVLHLARAPVMLNEVTKTGVRRRPVPELTEDYGRCCLRVIADLTIQNSYYDADSGVFYEAVARRREIQPKFNAQIDTWLRLFGGALYEKLCDWLACAPDLNKMLCALYLAGHKGSGKTIFANALAKIWTAKGHVSELDKIMENFNEELTHSPVVLGDEALPKHWKGTAVTTKLRSIISTMTRTLSRKHKAPAELNGAIRLILTANNEFLLSGGEDSSSHADLAAVAQRFLYIDVPEAASKFMEEIGQERVEQIWLKQDGFAAHALWLEENRLAQIVRGSRFWVEGSETAMHRLLVTGTAWNSLVLEWLVRYLINPSPIDNQKHYLILRRRGELLVNEKAIIDGWEILLKTNKQPDTTKIGEALRSISAPKRRNLRINKNRVRYRVVDPHYVFDWAERNGIGDRQQIQAAIDGSTESGDAADEEDGEMVH